MTTQGDSMLDEAEIRGSMAGHAERNAELLEHLRKKGVRLDTPQSVEHHFWAEDQQSAAGLAKELYGRGYLIVVISPADTEDGSKLWNVEAGISRTLREAADPAVTEDLVRLAGRFNATYDGWGASV